MNRQRPPVRQRNLLRDGFRAQKTMADRFGVGLLPKRRARGIGRGYVVHGLVFPARDAVVARVVYAMMNRPPIESMAAPTCQAARGRPSSGELVYAHEHVEANANAGSK
ncbi:hypothetical protein AL755_13240 [Arthrobacter sp. ERGS1:01]|nr:hypothetical protein AL755_13240 [Arthrobacter sp. ERGS1:01]